MQVLSYDTTASTMRVGGGMTYSELWRAATAVGMSWKVSDLASAYQDQLKVVTAQLFTLRGMSQHSGRSTAQ